MAVPLLVSLRSPFFQLLDCCVFACLLLPMLTCIALPSSHAVLAFLARSPLLLACVLDTLPLHLLASWFGQSCPRVASRRLDSIAEMVAFRLRFRIRADSVCFCLLFPSASCAGSENNCDLRSADFFRRHFRTRSLNEYTASVLYLLLSRFFPSPHLC